MKNVLLVDDNGPLAEMLSNVVASAGHSPTVASRAEQALTLVESETFDLVLLDVVLPGVGGLAVYRRIRTLQPNAQIVLITGYRPESLLERLEGQGAVVALRAASRPEQVVSVLGGIGARGTVLAVTRDPKFGERLAEALAQTKAWVCTSAADLTAETRPDDPQVVVLDLQRPFAENLVACADLRDSGVAAKLVIILVDTSAGNRKPLESFDLTHCLFKPFDLGALISIFDAPRHPRR